MTPGTFVFLERWRDMAAVQAHFAEDYNQEIVGVIRALSVRSSGVEIHAVASRRVVHGRLKAKGRPVSRAAHASVLVCQISS